MQILVFNIKKSNIYKHEKVQVGIKLHSRLQPEGSVLVDWGE